MVPRESKGLSTLSEGYLSNDDFQRLIAIAPLVSIDIVALNDADEVLVGLRRNSPARDYWFVPGGRIRKGESIESAFGRVTQDEFNRPLTYANSRLLGVYDHFYEDSVFDQGESTHYVTITFLSRIATHLTLPEVQHCAYRWVPLDHLSTEVGIHPNTQTYAKSVVSMLSLAEAPPRP